MVWLIFQIKHLEGKDKPVGLRFDASNLETHSRNSLRGDIHKKGGTRFPRFDRFSLNKNTTFLVNGRVQWTIKIASDNDVVFGI